MQAFVLNLRRDKFKDPRVRRALNLAFPFEDIRKTIFSGQYERVSSYFHGLEIASAGLPEGQELAILESVRDKVPAKVFSEPYANPVGDTPDAVRNNLREADRLLREAGWELKDRRRVNAKGETLTIELLGDSPNDERIYLPYKAVSRPARHRHHGADRRRRPAREPNALVRFRHRLGHLGPVPLAGQRAARVLGIAGRQAGKARAISRASRIPGVDALIDRVIFAQGPSRTRRRHEGARPGAARPRLHGAAMDLRHAAHRPLEPLQPP